MKKLKVIFIFFLIILILYLLLVLLIRHRYPLFLSREEREKFYTGMRHVHNVLETNNIPYFIICGTLLGSIREGEIIPWDDDIDIGIMESDMEKFNSLDFGYRSSGASENSCGKIYLDEKLYIDVFPFEKKGDRYQYIEKSARDLWPNDYFLEGELFPLKKYKFGNLEVSGPNNHLQYSERAWGKDWRKPVFKNRKMLAYPIEMLYLRFGGKI